MNEPDPVHLYNTHSAPYNYHAIPMQSYQPHAMPIYGRVPPGHPVYYNRNHRQPLLPTLPLRPAPAVPHHLMYAPTNALDFFNTHDLVLGHAPPHIQSHYHLPPPPPMYYQAVHPKFKTPMSPKGIKDSKDAKGSKTGLSRTAQAKLQATLRAEKALKAMPVSFRQRRFHPYSKHGR